MESKANSNGASAAGTNIAGASASNVQRKASAKPGRKVSLSQKPSVRKTLWALGLEQYAEEFDDQGYDDLNYLRKIAKDDDKPWKELVYLCDMKAGHASKLQSALQKNNINSEAKEASDSQPIAEEASGEAFSAAGKVIV